MKNKPVQLPDGTILCPSSTEHGGVWRVHVEMSTDGGETWTVAAQVDDPTNLGPIQPSILVHSVDGARLSMVCRTQRLVLGRAHSTDGGRSWTAVSPMALPNPNSGTDATTLRDGRQLLVYNHTLPLGKPPWGRAMLNIAIRDSDGDGDSAGSGGAWRPTLTLELAAAERRAEFSYPSVVQASDGAVHVTYTHHRRAIRHVALDPHAIGRLTSAHAATGRRAAL